jgi:hypothetical protein
MPDLTTTADRIVDSRERLALKLVELQRRVTRARTLLSPRTYLDSPWIRVGVGIVVGYLLGRVGTRTSADDRDGAHDGIVLAAFRTSMMTLASAVIRRAIIEAHRPDTIDRASR